MWFKNVALTLLLLLLSLTMSAQKFTVTGRVLDSVTGEGVPFAGVFEKGTMNGVSTDDEGRFTINVNQGGQNS